MQKHHPTRGKKMNKEKFLKRYSRGERDFSRANLRGANLGGADLRGADLGWANLGGANLSGTILAKGPLPLILSDDIIGAGLETDGGFVIGWRTKKSTIIGTTTYEPGKVYTAPVFSTCQDSPCHPGIYFASKEWLIENYGSAQLVRCCCLRSELLHVGNKWRCKRLMILPEETV